MTNESKRYVQKLPQIRKVPYLEGIRKIGRFWSIYGFRRTAFKVFGRSRRAGAWLLARPRGARHVDVAIIGCGQFAFASIAYILFTVRGRCIRSCFDIDRDAMDSFARSLKVSCKAKFVGEAIEDPQVRVVYIASNHYSHTEYAVLAARAGKHVYIEKPICVSTEQFEELVPWVEKNPSQFSFGYNRPFASAIVDLRKRLLGQPGALTLSCFISGHQLADDHWYRDPKEGTRICGNVGHWLDLAVNILSVNRFPTIFSISLTWAEDEARDDNLCICLASESGDLVNIVISSRSEPFEGINESINLQWGNVIAKIDDFRRMTIWTNSKKRTLKYRPKDIGHRGAVMQPFSPPSRNVNEVLASTRLMLEISEMIVEGRRSGFCELAIQNQRD